MRMPSPLTPFALSLVLAASGALAQTMYKWTDENGRVTYSDTPPVGNVRSKETINVPAAPPSGAARQLNAQDAQFKKRQDEAVKAQADAAKKEEIARQKADNCSRARGELRALRDNAPVARLTENGERVILDAGARESEGKRLESYLEENCIQPG
jgi:hypothetical protein